MKKRKKKKNEYRIIRVGGFTFKELETLLERKASRWKPVAAWGHGWMIFKRK